MGLQGKLTVVGGGNGNDLLRSGRDFQSIWSFDISDAHWEEKREDLPMQGIPLVAVSNEQGLNVSYNAMSVGSGLHVEIIPLNGVVALGRCHTGNQIGSRLVCFGGCLRESNEVTVVDLESHEVYAPRLKRGSIKPYPRFSHVATLIETRYKSIQDEFLVLQSESM